MEVILYHSLVTINYNQYIVFRSVHLKLVMFFTDVVIQLYNRKQCDFTRRQCCEISLLVT